LDLIQKVRSLRGLFGLQANQRIELVLDWKEEEALYPMISHLIRGDILSVVKEERKMSVAVGSKQAYVHLGETVKIETKSLPFFFSS
jgi:hypothetical protein